MLWLLPARHMCSPFKWSKRRSVGIWIRFFPLFLCCVYMFESIQLYQHGHETPWCSIQHHARKHKNFSEAFWNQHPTAVILIFFFPKLFRISKSSSLKSPQLTAEFSRTICFAKSTWGKGKTAISGCTNSWWLALPISDPTIFHTFGLREIGEAVLQSDFWKHLNPPPRIVSLPPDRSWVIESWVAPSSICVQVSSNLSIGEMRVNCLRWSGLFPAGTAFLQKHTWHLTSPAVCSGRLPFEVAPYIETTAHVNRLSIQI